MTSNTVDLVVKAIVPTALIIPPKTLMYSAMCPDPLVDFSG